MSMSTSDHQSDLCSLTKYLATVIHLKRNDIDNIALIDSSYALLYSLYTCIFVCVHLVDHNLHC